MATETNREDLYEKYHVKATTLLEFFSVSIQRDTRADCFIDDLSFDVYGHIKLINPYGREFFLFKREKRSPETVFILHNRTAVLPKPLLPQPEGYYPHGLPEYFWIEVYLVDKSLNVTIVDHHLRKLDFCRRKILYDEEQEILITSRGYGRVTLKYTIFRSALLALVSLGVCKNGSGAENSATAAVAVTGSISANTNVKGKRGRLSRVLCDMYTTEHVRESMSLTTNGDYTWLPALAVPAYSLLRITTKLVVDGDDICTGDDAMEFEPDDASPVPVCKEIMGAEWRICLRVFWVHPYAHLYRNEFDGELVRFWDESCLSEADLSGELNGSSEKRFNTYCFARNLVEVFSVYVGGSFSHRRPLRVYGTIKYIDSCTNYSIFKREEEEEPEIVFPYESISLLTPPHCEEYMGPYFGIHLDLKDAGGLEISKGGMIWGSHTIDRWSDNRICSVVKGEHGFACVHYAMFNAGVTAKVQARLCYDGPGFFLVHGSIYARYSTYRYKTNYEKKYYRSTLFKKKKKDCDVGYCPCDVGYCHPDVGIIPLSKDVVALPCGNQLVLEVNIHVRVNVQIEDSFSGVFEEEIFRGELAFNPEFSTMICVKEIKGRKSRAKVFEGRKSPLLVRRKKIRRIPEPEVGSAREPKLELEVAWG